MLNNVSMFVCLQNLSFLYSSPSQVIILNAIRRLAETERPCNLDFWPYNYVVYIVNK